MTDATLNTIPRDGAERLALILTRVRGEFDDPLLARWGPLGTMEQDLAEMLTGSRAVWTGDPIPDPVEALGLEDPGDVFERPGAALQRLFTENAVAKNLAVVIAAVGGQSQFWDDLAAAFADHLGHGAKPEPTDLPMDGTQASYRQILEQALRVMDEAAGFDERDRALVEAHERLSALMAAADQLEGKVEGTITLGLDVLARVTTIESVLVNDAPMDGTAASYREIAEAALRALSSASYFSFRPDWSPYESCKAAGKELNRLREALTQADKAARALAPAREAEAADGEDPMSEVWTRLRRLEDRVGLLTRAEARRLETPAPEGQP